MKIIGLVGGVASGKSMVADMFRQLGASVLDADRIGHEVLRLPAVRAAIGGRWGKQVIGADGEVDRRQLAQIVFAPPPEGPLELAELERITHPEIRKRLKSRCKEMAHNGTKVAVLDAPVLLKAGWDSLCDAIVFVDAPGDQRRLRAAARGWNSEEFARREAAQESVEDKRLRANIVLDNSQDVSYIQSQVQRCWQAILKPGG